MDQTPHHAIILAGGLGIRLWPLSRSDRPKQFLRFGTMKTLLQHTFERLAPLFPRERIWVVAKPSHQQEVLEELPDMDPQRLLLEPCPKGTAAAVTWACASVHTLHPGATLGIFPSDHIIDNEEGFRAVLARGLEWAEGHPDICLFGILPDWPETDYGYIESTHPCQTQVTGPCAVRAFHEKPDRKTAERYVTSGCHFWNSGIFAFSTPTFIETVQKTDPALHGRLMGLIEADPSEVKKLYAGLPDTSIDTAIMEKAPNLVVFPCAVGWQDMGLWETVFRTLPIDEAGNAVKGEAVTIDCSRSLLYATGETLIAAVGLRDMIVVANRNAVLVCPRDRRSEVRRAVEEIKKRGLDRKL